METRRDALGVGIFSLVAEIGGQKHQELPYYDNLEETRKQNFDAENIRRGME